jgi:hypothetical protein
MSRIPSSHVFRSSIQEQHMRAAVTRGNGCAQTSISAPYHEYIVQRFSPELGSD